MSSEDVESVVAVVYEEVSMSVADVLVRRPNIPTPIDGDEYEYSWLLSSYDGSDGVESRLRREEGPIDFCEETAFEAIRAGVDPREVEAAFQAANVARREIVGRPTEVAATDNQEDWETNTPIGQAFVTLADMMDVLDGRSLTFDFQSYLAAHPYQSSPRSDFRVAQDGPWFMNALPSTTTVEDISKWRVKYQIPSDVHFYVPEPNERAEQPPAGMVAIDVWLLEAGLLPAPLCGHQPAERLDIGAPPADTSLLLVALSDHPGCHYVQSRGKKVLANVPNRHRGDRSKWFWVAGAWKTVSSDRPSVGIDIPTSFGSSSPDAKKLIARF
ncbi:hypothetical protein OROMI_004274 [Orobanche minor]